jgi:hypothetical protein
MTPAEVAAFVHGLRSAFSDLEVIFSFLLRNQNMFWLTKECSLLPKYTL